MDVVPGKKRKERRRRKKKKKEEMQESVFISPAFTTYA